jgi:two-component system, OmpR family, response regulator
MIGSVMSAGDRLPRVLVVDDELNIRELVQVALRFHGFTVTSAATGAEALRQAAEARPDLVVLDVMLPDLDGFEVCRRFRAGGNDVPVIFLTARDTSSDTVTGLALGGDDYVTKPFSVEALVARIRAVLRRAGGVDGAAATGGDDELGTAEVLRVADLELDEARWTARRRGTELELSPTEFRLLAFLMRHPGRVLTRAQLLEHVWGWDYGGQSQIVETYISYLRRKLDPLGPPLIHTQRGVGYALRPGTAGGGPAAPGTAAARDGG